MRLPTHLLPSNHRYRRSSYIPLEVMAPARMSTPLLFIASSFLFLSKHLHLYLQEQQQLSRSLVSSYSIYQRVEWLYWLTIAKCDFPLAPKMVIRRREFDDPPLSPSGTLNVTTPFASFSIQVDYRHQEMSAASVFTVSSSVATEVYTLWRTARSSRFYHPRLNLGSAVFRVDS